ncbi:MAG: hypothetical protein OSA41_04400 [Erythrobacter sp.]|jgi:hypothetical protein|uniref:hypothetical protein n=1 Tax=Qipengyuania citrea TaxID=225971 RepID=UPI0020A1B938|nr:hypothetical protein [Qipengyuania citrea]MCP2016892.1 hypothetical protein [Qipengyuania citrea]MDE0900939.1 hypothetical protein [Erythrobacter sp.]
MKRIVIALLAPLLLGGCLLSPGKFASELQLFADDQFAFTYDGEIQMLALSKLAEMANNGDESFVAECYDADFEMAECSEAEIAEQQAEWDAGAEDRRAEQAREAEKMRAVMGGIDPANPQAAQELAARLERQRGWQRVTYKGDGVFDVAFAVSGTLTHDFTFPTIEGMLGANAFVSVNLRDGAQVRVDAPDFSRQQDSNPMFGGGSLAALAAMAEADESGDIPQIVMPEGTFTIVTDGRVLANNTDEGPAPHAAGQSLSWTIGATTRQAPTALIAFD